MKQTAVEWLQLELKKLPMVDVTEVFQQALSMEKEQIMRAVYDAMGTNFDPNMGRAELYYNETYGK